MRDTGTMSRPRTHRYHRNRAVGVKTMPKPNDVGSLPSLVADFLAELAHTNRSRHTCRAYATDLAQSAVSARGCAAGSPAEVTRAFGPTLERLGPASRASKQAALASFLEWARRQG